MKRILRAIALALALAPNAVVPAAANPSGQRQISRGAVSATGSTARPLAQNLVYGTIVSERGSTIVVRTRTGRLQTVDATDAIASGMYSAPLVIGKIVVVRGSFDPRRALHAQSISRLTRLDESTGPDR